MNLRERCFAVRGLSISLMMSLSLLVAEPGAAQENEPELAFDVPDRQGESVTISLRDRYLERGVVLDTTNFRVERRQSEGESDILGTMIVGDYCVTISNPGIDIQTGESPVDLFLDITTRFPGGYEPPAAKRSATNRGRSQATEAPDSDVIGVTDTNEPGGTVEPSDQSCLAPRTQNQPPIAKLKVGSATATGTRLVPNQGSISIPDQDSLPGEMVVLDASDSTDPEGGDLLYAFLDQSGEQLNKEGQVSITVPLADGPNSITLRVTEAFNQNPEGGDFIVTKVSRSAGASRNRSGSNGEGYGGYGGYEGYDDEGPLTNISVANINVLPPGPKVVISIRPDATVPDRDGADGEIVTLDGSASQAPENALFKWFRNPNGEDDGTPFEMGEAKIITPRLNNGPTKVRLVVTVGESQFRADADVTVLAPASVTANAGTYAPQGDTDGFPGEVVQLDGSGSTIPADATATFQWFRDPVGESNGVALGTGQKITPRLKDGTTLVRLLVTVNGVASLGDASITVGSPGQATKLTELPNLTPNQRRVATALDDVCGRLIGLTSTLNGPAQAGDLGLTANQADLSNKCRGIAINNTTDNQVEAITDLTPDDFAVARTQALLFANTQYASVMDRLIALRGGARGLSLAGLSIQVDGNTVPLVALKDMIGKMLGGGASADDATEEQPGLLSDRWGMWMRGNYSTGGRDKSLVSPSFDVDQSGITFGTDYRLSNKAVIGASIAYLDSQIEFNPLREGSLDTTSMALSLYGSVYAARSFYLDALANVAKADYKAERNISFSQGSNLGALDMDANGDTDGITLSAGLSGGYDFLLFKRVTFAPNAGFFYVDATIDGFLEDGASGFNLLYDEQNFKSFTGNLGFRVNTVINTPWVVLLPGLRLDYIREFNDDVDVFQVRFAADPNGNSAPPISIQTDNPDTSYWRMSLNLSAQFKFGFAGYVEYQRIDSFSNIDFQDLAFGLRMQRAF